MIERSSMPSLEGSSRHSHESTNSDHWNALPTVGFFISAGLLVGGRTADTKDRGSFLDGKKIGESAPPFRAAYLHHIVNQRHCICGPAAMQRKPCMLQC